MAEMRRGRISHATYLRTVGQMLTRDWYALDECEVLTGLDLVERLVATYPDRYPSKGWAARAVLDKAIAGVVALCRSRSDPASARLASFLEARQRGQSVADIARGWGLSREYVSRSVGRKAILLVTDRMLALNRRLLRPGQANPPLVVGDTERSA